MGEKNRVPIASHGEAEREVRGSIEGGTYL